MRVESGEIKVERLKMKNKLFIIHYSLFISVIASVIAMMSSCDKVPINGDLDGMWQLMSVQTPDGTRATKSDRAYMCIQLHLSQWDHGGKRYYAHFNHTGDSIFFYDFYHHSRHRSKADDNEPITYEEMTKTDPAEGWPLMDVWGIHNLDARYRVQTLNSDALVLEKADTVLTFRKF